jgi:lysozyme family protein
MSHPLKKQMIGDLIDREGGFVDHPADRGGPTRYGITQQVAREYGYKGPMSQLPVHLARKIYADRYWHSLRLETISELNEPLTESLFDFCVHSGSEEPALALQRVLNVLNRREKEWNDLVEDGRVGPATLGAIEALMEARGRDGLRVLNFGVDALRGTFLIELAEAQEDQEAFSYGWLRRVMELGKRAA